ncbi:hypothetical protein P1X15_19490 [Runella sp. MFBS21]|uniref:hypothetical protein n=1 Tax=Runella sp. MFBS21 TaxID=3034018 RepID=UPI0023F9248A|nr:hypothetical protein [Runella sp. MFBS21]MDF7819814.1 hypothetical protein [Runella sp. MFBS21]
MNEIYKHKLEILRQRIPIGLRHGLTLLEEVEGDLEKAEKHFVEEMVVLTISKTGVTSDAAIRYLTKSNFDIGLTIKRIDEERYTLTELIIRKYKDKKEEALDKVYLTIEEKYNLERDFWLNFGYLKNLPSEIYCFVAIMEWLNFEEREGYQNALSFNLDIVVQQIDKKLDLSELMHSLKKAENILVLVYEEYDAKKSYKNYSRATHDLRNNKGFQEVENGFKEQKQILINRLYEFVQNNVDKFP